jgi:hypothetical protein
VGAIKCKSLEIGELRVARLRVGELAVEGSLVLPPKS